MMMTMMLMLMMLMMMVRLDFLLQQLKMLKTLVEKKNKFSFENRKFDKKAHSRAQLRAPQRK